MQAARRLLWKIGHQLGGRRRQKAWDDQFARGHWDHLAARPDHLIDLYGRYCSGGVVVDLGCGEGHLYRHLGRFKPSLYVGVDVSQKAVDNAARAFAGQPARFVVCDIGEWREPIQADLIVLEESLYYVYSWWRFFRPWSRAIELVNHAVSCLRPGGAVVIAIHSASKWRKLCELLERHPARVSTQTRGERWITVLEAPGDPRRDLGSPSDDSIITKP